MINRDLKDLRTSRLIRGNIYDATAKSWIERPRHNDAAAVVAFVAGALFATVVILFTLGVTA